MEDNNNINQSKKSNIKIIGIVLGVIFLAIIGYIIIKIIIPVTIMNIRLEKYHENALLKIPIASKNIDANSRIYDDTVSYTEIKGKLYDEKYDGKIEPDARDIIGKCVINDVEKGDYFYLDNLVDCSINDGELRKDLDKKVELTSNFIVSGLYLNDDEMKYKINENIDAYPYLAEATYKYYLYKTGSQAEKYTTNDSSFSTCYEQAQNGYCYVVSKAEIEKYNKELYNISMDAFNLGDWTTTKEDKIYITPVPWNSSYSIVLLEVSSVERGWNSIEYVAEYSIQEGNKELDIIKVKYIFEKNTDGNYYLDSFEDER